MAGASVDAFVRSFALRCIALRAQFKFATNDFFCLWHSNLTPRTKVSTLNDLIRLFDVLIRAAAAATAAAARCFAFLRIIPFSQGLSFAKLRLKQKEKMTELEKERDSENKKRETNREQEE